MNQLQCIIIAGPTAVGKSDLVDTLVSRYPHLFEIINADMAQCYTPLTIGTAKPDLAKLAVPYHLFDIIDQPVNLTVSQYRALFVRALKDINDRGKIALVVGGSLFYLKSLFFPPSNLETKSLPELEAVPTPELYHQLQGIDPQRAASLYATDRYRIVRALEIYHSLNVLPSTLKPTFDPVGKCLFYFLTRDKATLHERINERTRFMIERKNGWDGWIGEVRGLDVSWHTFLMQKKLIGYPEIIQHIATYGAANPGAANPDDLKVLIDTISTKTRAYAKRQLTFWRSFNTLVHEVDPNHTFIKVIEATLDEATPGMAAHDHATPDEALKELLHTLHLCMEQYGRK